MAKTMSEWHDLTTIHKAIRLHAGDMTWEEVAAALGCSRRSIEAAVGRYRRGECTFQRKAKSAARVEEAKQVLLRGGRIVDIAREWGTSKAYVCRLLDRHGIYKENRVAMRKELQRAMDKLMQEAAEKIAA